MLLNEGADPNAKDNVWNLHRVLHAFGFELKYPCIVVWKFGMTALHKAAWEGHTTAAEWLLQEGADPNAVDNVSSRILHSLRKLIRYTVNCSS